MSNEMVTLPVFTEYLGRPIVPGSRDDLVRISVNSLMATYCERNFTAASYVDKISIPDLFQRSFFVKNPPIRALTSIGVGRPVTSTLSAEAYYVEDADSGLIRLTSGWLLVGAEMYTVTYDGGFLEIPADLQLAACSIAAREAEKAAKGRHGLGQRQIGFGGNELFVRDLEATEQRVMDSYRRVMCL